MVYFKVEQREEKDGYTLNFTDEAYHILSPYFVKDKYCSYRWVYFRLFNMLPRDYYHYIATKYHCIFKKHKLLPGYIDRYFKERQDAVAFANECNKRFTYALEEEKKNGAKF